MADVLDADFVDGKPAHIGAALDIDNGNTGSRHDIHSSV
jgi:hypothetical protein